jgi:hypothetical protein
MKDVEAEAGLEYARQAMQQQVQQQMMQQMQTPIGPTQPPASR